MERTLVLEPHPSEDAILQYVLDQLDGAERDLFRQHLTACGHCRERVTVEKAFDETLRLQISHSPAPVRLIQKIKADLSNAVALEEARRTDKAAWPSLAASAVAAALVLLVFVSPGTTSRLASGLVVGQLQDTTKSLQGRLVCLGCARQHASVDMQRLCTGGNRDHVTGLQTTNGELWRFVENEVVDAVMDDPHLRGNLVQLQARPLAEIGYLQVAAIRPL